MISSRACSVNDISKAPFSNKATFTGSWVWDMDKSFSKGWGDGIQPTLALTGQIISREVILSYWISWKVVLASQGLEIFLGHCQEQSTFHGFLHSACWNNGQINEFASKPVKKRLQTVRDEKSACPVGGIHKMFGEQILVLEQKLFLYCWASTWTLEHYSQ